MTAEYERAVIRLTLANATNQNSTVGVILTSRGMIGYCAS